MMDLDSFLRYCLGIWVPVWQLLVSYDLAGLTDGFVPVCFFLFGSEFSEQRVRTLALSDLQRVNHLQSAVSLAVFFCK